MERKQIVHNAYAVVGQLSKGYDGMMKNESLLGRLANRFFWQLSGSRYESFVRQAFQGIPKGFSGTLLEVPVGTGVLSLPHYHRMKSAKIVEPFQKPCSSIAPITPTAPALSTAVRDA